MPLFILTFEFFYFELNYYTFLLKGLISIGAQGSFQPKRRNLVSTLRKASSLQ